MCFFSLIAIKKFGIPQIWIFSFKEVKYVSIQQNTKNYLTHSWWQHDTKYSLTLLIVQNTVTNGLAFSSHLWSYLWFTLHNNTISSVQFSHSVVSDSSRPHESQHARPPCPSPTPGVHSDSCPSSQWCHPAISSSVVPFSSCPNPSHHQSLFPWVNSSHEVAKVLEFQL